ncbi:neutrophil gelatinase-associated lipocalin [Perognathus longimembris pacificus]|uniref:neutrophil gelatinase-associated lipocalin n=1 Tax=Perognathus longimembris pacificus TaxID=214514 RepID=UPI002019426A|nr:neutrophil gelatinase-associated lipocalin [Perognathus longimembris pacificus]
MTLGLLWLGLTLLGVLQAQTPDSAPNLIPAPSLRKVPLKRNFQDAQFQGKWYVVGLAGNAVQKKQGDSKMYTTTYELKEDRSYNVTSTLLRDQGCDYWIRTFVPSFRPGQYTLGNIRSYPNLQSYIVRVTATDYTQFAMVFFKKTSANREYFKTTLYGRTKELGSELKNRFVRFAKSLGLTDDHITFLTPIDQCIDD